MEVLRLFTPQRREIGVSEAADLLDRPKSSVSRHLSTMHVAGFLDRSVHGRYRISMHIAAIGEMAKQATSLQQRARPILETLTAATGETSNLSVRMGPDAVNVEAVESPQPVMHMGSVGRRFALHASAAGKILLAWLPEEEIWEVLHLPLMQHTPSTITRPGALLQELARVREQGYAVNWTELEQDLVAVGAPVWDHRNELVAAVSISAPVSRLPRSGVPTVSAHVRAAADQLSRALGCST